jgi:diamine N-acetyltransferase
LRRRPAGATTTVTIRPVERRDVPTIAIMAGEFYAFLASINNSDPAFDIEAARLKLEQCGFGAKPLFSAIIAEQAGNPVGYAIYNIGFWADTFQGMVFVTDLFVREAWRGKGIGRRLMNHLAEIGKAEGCETVMWTVWLKNQAAKRFYAKIGGTPIEEEQLFTWPIR